MQTPKINGRGGTSQTPKINGRGDASLKTDGNATPRPDPYQSADARNGVLRPEQASGRSELESVRGPRALRLRAAATLRARRRALAVLFRKNPRFGLRIILPGQHSLQTTAYTHIL